MQIEYNKKTKTMEITGLTGLVSPTLYINDVYVQDLEVSAEYTFSSDGFYKITVQHLVLDLPTIEELGYVLVIEYTKDKLRALLIDLIEDERYDGLSEVYVKNKKIIREIEVSFYSGNIRRAELLMGEIKWH